jgi:hypothetical protein
MLTEEKLTQVNVQYVMGAATSLINETETQIARIHFLFGD